MATTDLALRFGDEEYDKISRKFLEDFDYFSDVFARAWFKLTHRDMGPVARYHGPEVPKEILLWQDPVPTPSYDEISQEKKNTLRKEIEESGIGPISLVKLAWYAASSFRNTDKRGGANGARIALEPQASWEANEPEVIKPMVEKLKSIASKHEVSLADLIVFAGSYAVEHAAAEAGISISVPFVAGRGDAIQEETDVESFNNLKPVADGFRNYASPGTEDIAEKLLIEKAALLGLTPPELVVLVGGLRVIGVTHGESVHGILTENPGTLDNSYFINLLSNDIAWAPRRGQAGVYGSHAYLDGERKWSATRADLVFASNAVLRALAEVYASDDALEKFVSDFAKAWTKVMNADLFI
jgi:catalase-peroxidase